MPPGDWWNLEIAGMPGFEMAMKRVYAWFEREISVGWANSYYPDARSYVDEWAIGSDSQVYETPLGSGHYTEIVGHPLADDDEITAGHPPDPELCADTGCVLPELQVDPNRASAIHIRYSAVAAARIVFEWLREAK